uniref:Uncharacterized protein n=1 Tax=Ditylenchus dipsaci TaxID=166011 RepID=A0A915EE90_9BILA
MVKEQWLVKISDPLSNSSVKPVSGQVVVIQAVVFLLFVFVVISLIALVACALCMILCGGDSRTAAVENHRQPKQPSGSVLFKSSKDAQGVACLMGLQNVQLVLKSAVGM